MGLRMNLTPRATNVADMEPGGVEWQHSWTPSQAHDSELVQRLPALQRLLLTTDGTVTTALGTVVSEPVGVWLLDQQLHTLAYDDHELWLQAGCDTLLRRVLLYGSRSGTALLFGCSRIALGRLPSGALQALLDGDVPIGLALRTHRIETFRAPLSIGVGPATGDAAALLGAGLMCRRRYTIESGGLPLMVIDEQFRAAGFAETS
jgi:beta-ribofuranosylaminobenzene 5'-phosphate synthase